MWNLFCYTFLYVWYNKERFHMYVEFLNTLEYVQLQFRLLVPKKSLFLYYTNKKQIIFNII